MSIGTTGFLLIAAYGIACIALYLYCGENCLRLHRFVKPEHKFVYWFVPGTLYFPEIYLEGAEPDRRKCIKCSLISLGISAIVLVIFLVWAQ